MTIQFSKSAMTAYDSSVPRELAAPPQGLRMQRGVYGAFGKPLLDRLLVILSLPVVLPLLGLLALVVALDGGAPFYRQKRIGRGGAEFRILKLRTMIAGADRVLEQYLRDNPEARREWEHKQKLRDDPRITRVGWFLRKTSLDELPQLWNVLKGDMSLVGPRPMMVDQKDLYPGKLYYRLRPGITGPWQVSDRNTTDFSDRVFYDADYYRNLSLPLDLVLLVRTVGVVLRGTGC